MDSLSLLVYDLIFSIKLPEYPGMGHQVILPQRIYYCCFNNRVIMNNAVACSIKIKYYCRSYCEECGSAVWPMLQTIYQCRTCGHLVHAQCLDRQVHTLYCVAEAALFFCKSQSQRSDGPSFQKLTVDHYTEGGVLRRNHQARCTGKRSSNVIQT